MPHVLIIEDEVVLTNHLRDLLASIDCTCEIEHDGAKAEEVFGSGIFDLVLLDLNLPSKSGIELCRLFRKKNERIPIIVLTAFSDLDTKIVAFDYGADDYITKPFHGKELLAKVKVFLKRSERTAENNFSEFEDLSIDREKKEVVRAGKRISLSPKEYQLLDLLMRNQGRIVTKTDISRNIWDAAYDTGTNTVEVYICFLRNKIDKNFSKKLIQTKPGFGYLLGVAEE
jgi:two-component system, OmpR family, copper resistance phosphate regulon response regulator CusR